MAHSVPDAVGIAIETSAGRVFHTGDWKLDHTPVDGLRTDVGTARRARQPRRRPAARRLDERRAARASRAPSASSARRSARSSRSARGRVLISSFASNIHRMQQAIDVAVDAGRKVVVVGRSMRTNMNVARNLGYVDVPDDMLVKPADLDDVPPARAADPLHRLAGRAAVGADADRLQRPPGDQGRARRHGDHLGAPGARERAARARRDQPADARTAPRCCTRRTPTCTSRATRAPRSCARCSA